MERNEQNTNIAPKKKRGFIYAERGHFDYQTFFLTIFIAVFGIVMIYSASTYKAVMLGQDSAFFAKRQAIFVIAGILFMLIASVINYKYYANFAFILMIIAIILCGIVMIVGAASHGATRWIPLGPINFQPSEIAKPILIIFVSYMCMIHSTRLSDVRGLFKIARLPVICIILIVRENLSTAIICFVIVYAIMFVASPKLRYMIAILIFGIIAAVMLTFFVGYREDRLAAMGDPESIHQVIQSLYAIGSGGLFGKGLGESVQKMGFLPESHNDMIFAIVCEELGIVGGIGVLLLFVILIARLRYIANNAADSFGGFIVTGVIAHIVIQTLINVGVVTNLIPPTGVPMPFISYGGTSVFFLLIEIGMVLSVSRQIRPYEEAGIKKRNIERN